MTATSLQPDAKPQGHSHPEKWRWIDYFTFNTDHKVIGIQYLVTSFIFYLIGGVMATAIRTELATPYPDVLGFENYNGVLTLHGTIMIFLWIVPAGTGAFANYLIPLMGKGYGVSPIERRCLLDGSSRRFVTPLQLAHRNPWRGLDILPPLKYHERSSGADDLDSQRPGSGNLLDFGGAQLPHHPADDAHQGHDVLRYALVLLGDASHLGDGADFYPRVSRGADFAQFRSHCRDGVFQSHRWRRSDRLPALILVLFPPGGVHHDFADVRHHLGGAARPRPQANFRVYGDRLFQFGDLLFGANCLGAPHVHQRHPRLAADVLYDCHDGDRGSHGN